MLPRGEMVGRGQRGGGIGNAEARKGPSAPQFFQLCQPLLHCGGLLRPALALGGGRRQALLEGLRGVGGGTRRGRRAAW